VEQAASRTGDRVMRQMKVLPKGKALPHKWCYRRPEQQSQ
jgi:hypothetical protein